MAKIVVQGGRRLSGRIPISGAKNSVLPIMAASLLTKKEVVVRNVPWLGDVQVMAELIRGMRGEAIYADGTLTLRSNHLEPENLAHSELTNEIRYSTHFIGALLPRFKQVTLHLPGGCALGTRKLDSHILGFTKLGARVDVGEDYIKVSRDDLEGCRITLEYPSVGATENIITTACLAEGETTLENAAREPEIGDLVNFLNSIGAKIEGAGTRLIKIEGVDELGGTEYSIMPDRIETGTYIAATAVTGGEVVLENTDLKFLDAAIRKLRQIGVQIKEVQGGARVSALESLKPTDVITEVYPGFPTDMQPIITPLLSLADGESKVEEKIFDKRFNHVPELVKMGANIQIDGNNLMISGVKKLHGTEVTSLDIRAGGSLVVAALAAEGKTTINRAHQIFRGYEKIVEKLQNVGAEIASTHT